MVRGLDIVCACKELGLLRLLTWLAELLARPAECCEVAALAPEVRGSSPLEVFFFFFFYSHAPPFRPRARDARLPREAPSTFSFLVLAPPPFRPLLFGSAFPALSLSWVRQRILQSILLLGLKYMVQ